MTVKKTVFSALLAVMSLTLYIVEGMIPPVVAIPGFRIGLAYFPVLFFTVSRRSVESIRYRTDTYCTDIVVGTCIGQYHGFAVFSVRRYAVVYRNGGHAPFYKRSVGEYSLGRHILGGDA